MDNIVESVFNVLETRTDEISKDLEAQKQLEDKIKSGRYTADALSRDIYPKRNALRGKIQMASENAIQEALDLIAQYREEVKEQNYLDPAELTEDIKLLQTGIVLLPGDIQGILKRNKNNRTMTQIILRYANEHNIDTGRTYYIGGQKEEETAKNLEGVLSIYKKWIDKPNAKTMLYKFFNVPKQ